MSYLWSNLISKYMHVKPAEKYMVLVFQHLFLSIWVESKASEKHARVSGLQHRPNRGLVAISLKGVKASNQCNWNCFMSFGHL